MCASCVCASAVCKKCQKVLARYSKKVKKQAPRKKKERKEEKERTKLCTRSVGWFNSGKEAGKDSDKTDKETKF